MILTNFGHIAKDLTVTMCGQKISPFYVVRAGMPGPDACPHCLIAALVAERQARATAEADLADFIVAVAEALEPGVEALSAHVSDYPGHITAIVQRAAAAEQQLERHWVCPCCRRGCTDPDCCTAAETNGVAVIAAAEQRGREEGRASVLDIACLCHSVIQTAKCKYPDDFGAWANDQRTCLLGLGAYIDEHIHPTETDR